MTENHLRLGLLLIAAAILFIILFEAWHKRRHLKMMQSFESPNAMGQMPFDEPREPSISTDSASKNESQEQDLLMVSILAKPSCQFASYDLLQAILAVGFQFGEMNLFHFHLPANEGGAKLFSLASTTKSGEFDLDHIGDFSCKGLILFLDLNAVIEPKRAFDLMLSTAQRLSDDLDGELRADPHTPWNDGMLDKYEKKISDKRQTA